MVMKLNLNKGEKFINKRTITHSSSHCFHTAKTLSSIIKTKISLKMTHIFQKIEDTINTFNSEVQTLLENLIELRNYSKGEYLLKEGNICTKSFVLEQGIARKYASVNDKEITTELYFKNDIAVSFDSFCNQTPSREFIQALTDVSVVQLNYQDFQKLKLLHPELMKLDNIIAEHYTIWLEKRLLDFRTLTATERYLKLFDDNPGYINYVPLNILASYLGVAIETLSRIRGRI